MVVSKRRGRALFGNTDRRGAALAARWAAAAAAALLPLSASLASAAQTHVVQPGETLSAIADQYGETLADLVALNGIDNPDLIQAGASLTISGFASSPALRSYIVLPGDALSDIADQYGVLVRDLVELNGLENEDHIVIGQVLTLPASHATATRFRVSHDDAERALRAAELNYGLPSGLLLALAWQESGWQQQMVSESGAVGLTQILPDTANWALEWLAPESTGWEWSAQDNADMGAAILRHWLDLADGDVEVALGAYYQGWTRMAEYGPLEETREYVANVLALVQRFED